LDETVAVPARITCVEEKYLVTVTLVLVVRAWTLFFFLASSGVYRVAIRLYGGLPARYLTVTHPPLPLKKRPRDLALRFE